LGCKGKKFNSKMEKGKMDEMAKGNHSTLLWKLWVSGFDT
jgi:hypothetical protein